MAEKRLKKQFTMPHTFVILLIIIAAAVVLTWIIPSGSYARVEDPLSGREVVDATSFSYTENQMVNPLDVPMPFLTTRSMTGRNTTPVRCLPTTWNAMASP